MISCVACFFHYKTHGRIPKEKELAHNIIVSNHIMTADAGVLYILYPKNTKVVQKANVGSFDLVTRHKILVGGDKNQVSHLFFRFFYCSLCLFPVTFSFPFPFPFPFPFLSLSLFPSLPFPLLFLFLSLFLSLSLSLFLCLFLFSSAPFR